ncbi:MAG: DUF559 domain-containing protein [Mesorhizobium sp.]|nr:DUF559 domain-containing protein [Mesorhizobium sp.]RWC43010.1 MAG: DUF559 domain-containing protein [Mesorhizobium sp.]RWC52359.1 MAG: DUF559 domain-containing protein [Mesorhizobium sp.]RWC52441.1 MAG: DUF559 domain-containing protein [Mesorhizobium sp.]
MGRRRRRAARRLGDLGARRRAPTSTITETLTMPHTPLPDEARSVRLERDGRTVLRFWNDDVIRDIDNVCQHIVIAAGLAGIP